MSARLLTPLAVCAVILSGCLGAGDRDSRTGGDRPAAGTTLVLTTGLRGAEAEQPLQAWADEVARRSGGTLRIELKPGQYLGDPAVEQKIIDDVRSEKVALGAVGARAFDMEGARSFQALLAPALVTSQRLQDAVLNGPLGEAMLAGLQSHGLTGVGLFPGPLRRMLGVTRDYRTTSDFAGARVGLQRSTEAAAALRALGAKPVELPFEAELEGIDGYEQQIRSVVGDNYTAALRSVTANLVLWPRPTVIVGNPAALAKLSDGQRKALADAAPAGRRAFAAATAADEHDAIEILCRAGLRFVRFDTASLPSALQPVYDELDRDEATRRWVEQIKAMKAGLPAEPVPACPATTTTGAAKTGALDGVYRTTVSAESVARHDRVPVQNAVPENWGRWVLAIRRGRFLWAQQNAKACTWAFGTASIAGGIMTWDFIDGGGIAPTPATNKPGERFVWRARLYRGTLSLDAIEPRDMVSMRWRKTDERPSAGLVPKRCPPPVGALPETG